MNRMTETTSFVSSNDQVEERSSQAYEEEEKGPGCACDKGRRLERAIYFITVSLLLTFAIIGTRNLAINIRSQLISSLNSYQQPTTNLDTISHLNNVNNSANDYKKSNTDINIDNINYNTTQTKNTSGITVNDVKSESQSQSNGDGSVTSAHKSKLSTIKPDESINIGNINISSINDKFTNYNSTNADFVNNTKSSKTATTASISTSMEKVRPTNSSNGNSTEIKINSTLSNKNNAQL